MSGKIEGLFFVIENGNLKGLKNCCTELARQGVPAVITLGEAAMDEDRGLVRDLSEQGFEVCGKLPPEFRGEHAFAYQFERMKRLQDKFRQYAGRPLCGMTARQFVHNEATFEVAEALQLAYVFIRGAGGLDAFVYKPQEYDVKVLALSMIPAMDEGWGSLTEIPSWSGGGTPEDFRNILFGLGAPRVTVGVHTRVGGAKFRWWQVYRDFLDSRRVTWRPLDEFAGQTREMPASRLPQNRAITYDTPRPLVPLEEEPDCQR